MARQLDEPGQTALRVTCDTNVVIDALDGTRPAAVELFERVRAGEIDVAFATRLGHELQRHTLEEVRALVGAPPVSLPTAGRYGVTRYDSGDTYAGDGDLTLIPTGWRLGFGALGIDTYLGGAPGDISNPTLEPVGKLGALDSDHLEAHRRSGRDVFVTSDNDLVKVARRFGLDAVTPEELMARLRRTTA